VKNTMRIAALFFVPALYASAGDQIPYSKTRWKNRPVEWRKLPKQTWETFSFQKSAQVDPDGFDRRSKVHKKVPNRISRTFIVAPERLPIVGEVVTARSDHKLLFLGDTVFIEPNEPLQMGSVYDVSEQVLPITSTRDGRSGYMHPIYGKIKVIGVRDQKFIGSIIELNRPIRRGAVLLNALPELIIPVAIPAPQALEASAILPNDPALPRLATEGHIVIIDAGTTDGLKAGMVLRNYQKRDPIANEDITAKDFIVDSEMIVVEANERYSSVLVLSVQHPLTDGAEVVALTDLKDFRSRTRLQTLIQDRNPVQTMDDLDEVDPGQSVGEQEASELLQLEALESEIQRVAPKNSYSIPLDAELAPDDGSTSRKTETIQTNSEEFPDLLPPDEPQALDPVPPTAVEPPTLQGSTSPAPIPELEPIPELAPLPVDPVPEAEIPPPPPEAEAPPEPAEESPAPAPMQDESNPFDEMPPAPPPL
jgi:hypothetical protein